MTRRSTVDFEAPLAAFAKELDLNMVTAIRMIALDILTRIVKRTPVDTGRARSGWDLTLGEPSSIVPPETEEKGRKVKAKQKFKSVFAGGATVAVPAAAAGIDGTQKVYIINNLPYIERLEEGWSKQAPAGMVRLSLAEVEAEVEIMLKKVIAEKNR